MTNAEASMRQAGIDKYLNRQAKLAQNGAAAERDDYARIIRDHLLAFTDRIHALVDQEEARSKAVGGRTSKVLLKVQYLEAVTVAYITLSTIMSSIISIKEKAIIATKVGSAIEYETKFHHVAKTNPKLWKRLVKYSKERGSYRHKAKFVLNTAAKEGVSTADWSPADLTFVGAFLLNIAEEVGLVVSETITKAKQRNTELRLSEAVTEWLHEHRKRAEEGTVPMIQPVYAPMTSAPVDWSSLLGGGYHTFRYPLVKRSSTDYSKADMTRVYRAVNLLQRTPWHVNSTMLALVEHYWSQGIQVGKLPLCVQQEVPGRLPDDEWEALPEEGRKAQRLQLSKTHAMNRQAAGDLVSVEMVLAQARSLTEDPEIYLPYQLDYRGRAYCMPLLSPQGVDYVRSILEFAHGKPVGERGGMWLALQCASLWDGEYQGRRLSKASFQLRYEWTEENEDMLRAVVEDPIANVQWQEADKPWMFLRTAADYVGFLDHGDGFVSCVPVALDGSCSGVQHYAAQLRDTGTAKSVNLLPCEEPEDVYAEVAEAVKALVESDPRSNTPNSEERGGDAVETARAFWMGHGITRKVVKTPVMTYGYSSREAGFTRKYQKDFVEPALAALDRKERSDPIARYLAKLTLAAVEARLTAVAEGMEWLIKCAELLASEEKGVSWTAPSGFPVTQKYMDTPTIRVETYLAGERLRISIPGKERTLNKEKQCSAISPNHVHSLDAAHLVLTVLEAHDAYDIKHFAMIHDSFGTLAADTDGMFASVRDAFVDMYLHHDPMEELYERVKADLSEAGRVKLPVPPAKGDLDIEEVRNSLYAFA